MTDLHDQVSSILEDEGIDPDSIRKIMALVDKAEAHRLDADRDIQPCTAEAIRRGCTCSMSVVRSTDIDPPYERIDPGCLLHGNPSDPDDDYDARHTGD